MNCAPFTLRPCPRQLLLALCCAGLLAACGQSATTAPTALELKPDTACSLDGMVLLDYPGPKAQIHYAQGNPEFFCDTVEMFSIYLQPEQQKRVTALFVQDMATADWNRPLDHWIDAKSAFYVVGSKRRGSMGPTLASFGNESAAQAFAQKEGGKVHRFNEITPAMVALDGGVIKDRLM
ncbi:MAG: nitrous oxide reductase accessory protein NosL [Betaproteobacteria bacterium]